MGKLFTITLLALTLTSFSAGRRAKDTVVLNITKCKDRSKNECGFYERIEWKSPTVVCPVFTHTPLSPWWSAMRTVDPPFKCAGEKGKFTIRNLTIDETAQRVLPVPRGYWIFEWELFDDTVAPYCCFVLEAEQLHRQ